MTFDRPLVELLSALGAPSADILNRAFPQGEVEDVRPFPARAGRVPPDPVAAARAGAVGVTRMGLRMARRPGHVHGNVAVPVVVFAVSLILLRRWWT